VFYVYAHLRKTDNSVFYIGKGSGDRAFVKSNRNKMWRSVFEKHGCIVVILSRWENEDDAFAEEERLISHYGIENLTNMTNGGRGAPGVEFSKERKELHRNILIVAGRKQVEMLFVIQRKCMKRVFTKCGKSFLGAPAALKWMHESLGLTDATREGISHAAKKGGQHCGVFFRYKNVKFMEKKPNRRREVGNSLGERFQTIRDAVRHMRNRGIKTTSPTIHNAINGKCITAGGLRWGYVENDEIKIVDFVRKTKFKKIQRSDGVLFNSLQEAAKETNKSPAAHKNISLCALGKTKTAYGYTWRYLDDSTS